MSDKDSMNLLIFGSFKSLSQENPSVSEDFILIVLSDININNLSNCETVSIHIGEK